MAKYIECDAAYRFAQDQLKKETGAYTKGWNNALGVMKGALHNNDAIPAADVVPVIRCGECRYAPIGTDDGEEQGFGLEWPEDEQYQTNPCPFRCEDGWYSHKPQLNFFCAHGRRKDGDKE